MSFQPRAHEHLGQILCGRLCWRAAVGTWCLAGVLVSGDALAQSFPTRPTELLAIGPRRLLELAALTRPAPVSQDLKRLVLSMLPPHGEITELGNESIEKLRGLSTVLRQAGRESAYEIKVVDVPQAAIANYFRSAILISQPALRLLDRDELQAVIAHELGHEYVWAEYDDAVNRWDWKRLRELELVCDAIAVLILRSAGFDETVLIRALEKISRFNLTHFGRAVNERGYPSLHERRKLVRTLSKAFLTQGLGNK